MNKYFGFLQFRCTYVLVQLHSTYSSVKYQYYKCTVNNINFMTCLSDFYPVKDEIEKLNNILFKINYLCYN